MTVHEKKQGHQFVQTYSLTKGLNEFGEQGRKAAFGEMKQLHDRVVFEPIRVEEMTQLEKRQAMESLIFLVEKRDSRIKARTCTNGSTQREYTDRDDAASPEQSMQSKEETLLADMIPNAFVQTDINAHEKGKRIIMKIRGPLVNM